MNLYIKIAYVILLFQLAFLGHGQKAILFSSSIGYYNYRQTANTLKVYHKLKEYGFDDQDIILMIPQNIGCCEKNPLYGSVSFIDNDYQNINHDVQIDFDYTDINLSRVFNILRMKFQTNDIQKIKFSPSQQPQPLFVYITGHGGNTYFKIRQRQAIIMENFKNLFYDFSFSQKFSKILLITDSCSAITPFQSVDIQNFTAFGSSAWDEKSQSHGFDNILNTPKSDDFTFYLIEYLQQNDPRHKTIYLEDLFKYMSFEKLKVHARIVGKGRKKLKQINELIVRNRNPVLKKQFILQNHL